MGKTYKSRTFYKSYKEGFCKLILLLITFTLGILTVFFFEGENVNGFFITVLLQSCNNFYDTISYILYEEQYERSLVKKASIVVILAAIGFMLSILGLYDNSSLGRAWSYELSCVMSVVVYPIFLCVECLANDYDYKEQTGLQIVNMPA